MKSLMRWSVIFPVTAVLVVSSILLGDAPAVLSQNRACSPKPPREVVESLWKMATLGELLQPDRQKWASSAYFAVEKAAPGNGRVQVFSNYWGTIVAGTNDTTSHVEVEVEYYNAGEIDSALRYIPPPKRTAYKTALVYRLISVPEYDMFYSPNGAVAEKRPNGCNGWRIEGSLDKPFATVNAAIRYVLEMRNKFTDPAVRKNADETIQQLLKWP